MSAFWYLTWTPLPSAAVWFFLSAYLIHLERHRTWTEVFFVGLCASVGGYALSDAIFFSLTDERWLTYAASASLASLTFASFFIFLYGVSLYRRFRGFLLLGLIPVAFFIVTFPEEMFKGFTAIEGNSAPFVPNYNPTWLYPWTVMLVFFAAGGVYAILRTVLEIRHQSPRIARRIALVLIGFVAAFGAGAATNATLALSGNPSPPFFSTTLVLPGILILVAATPTVVERLNAAVLRRKSSQYDVKGAFLTFSDGTLIGSKLVPEEQMIDADSFSATLDVIQNFMRTSFPTLRGKWLKSIRHGDYTLVMERGQYAYLTLVIGGQENDQLRRKAIETLDRFEQTNRTVLETWRGMAKDAQGVDELLTGLVSGG
jgi:hypothetical protein